MQLFERPTRVDQNSSQPIQQLGMRRLLPQRTEIAGRTHQRFADGSLESPDQADESQERTYVDIDTFLESF